MRDTLEVFDVDVVHLHGVDPERYGLLANLPATVSLLLTFVDCDLHAVSGARDYTRQLALIERAERVSVASVEMRETLLAKFGRALLEKLFVVPYGVPEAALDKTATQRAPKGERICKIAIGHRGDAHEQQRQALAALGALSDEQKQKLCCVVPRFPTSRSKSSAASCPWPSPSPPPAKRRSKRLPKTPASRFTSARLGASR